MKKIITFIFLFMQSVLFTLLAQTVLTYSTHGMNEGDILTLKQIEAGSVKPTAAGPNQVWDYSGARIDGSHVIHYNANGIQNQNSSAKSFACEQDGELTVHYDVTQSQKLYKGKSDQNVIIELTEPLVEMSYPFVYQSEIKGKMIGNYTTVATGKVDAINGEYSVVADAYGTLILPNGVKLDNVLRVKYVKDYEQLHYGSLFHIISERYLFYSSSSRYPVMQIIETRTACDCACSATNFFACFDDNVKPTYQDKKGNENDSKLLGNRFAYRVYPNPSDKDFLLEYDIPVGAKVKMSVLDLAGKEVQVLVDDPNHVTGQFSLMITMEAEPAATYILKMVVGDKVYTEKLIKKKNR